MTIAYETTFAGYEKRRDQLRDWVKRHYVDEFDLRAGMTLLDAGCGDGFWADLLAEHGLLVTGFDLKDEYIAAGRDKYPRLTLDVADAEQPLPYGGFDVVFCRTISHLYQPTLDAATAVIWRLLHHVDEGGMLLLTAYTDGTGHDHPGLHGGVFRHHPVASYEQMFADAGGTVRRHVQRGNYQTWAVA